MFLYFFALAICSGGGFQTLDLVVLSGKNSPFGHFDLLFPPFGHKAAACLLCCLQNVHHCTCLTCTRVATGGEGRYGGYGFLTVYIGDGLKASQCSIHRIAFQRS